MAGEDGKMGCPAGFEPATLGITTRCAANCAKGTTKTGSRLGFEPGRPGSVMDVGDGVLPLAGVSNSLREVVLIGGLMALGIAMPTTSRFHPTHPCPYNRVVRASNWKCVAPAHDRAPFVVVVVYGHGCRVRTDVCFTQAALQAAAFDRSAKPCVSGNLASQEGFEPSTCGFGDRRSAS